MSKAAVLCALTLLACGKATGTDAGLAAGLLPEVQSAAVVDPILGRIDLSELHASHVRDRLARLPPTLAAEDAALQALTAAAEDLLAVREMVGLQQGLRAGERPWQAAERFAANVWPGDANCEADPGDVKLLYLQRLARYKHPAKFAVWDAQIQCCPDPGACPPPALSACRQATAAIVTELATAIGRDMAKLPALALPPGVTQVGLEASPVKGVRTDCFERLVAEFASREPRLQLRRYDFYSEGEPGFGAGYFRAGEPAIAAWAQGAALGAVSAPLATVWGWSVALLAALEPTRSGKADPAVLAEIKAAACQQLAERERQDWRDRLLRAATLRWNEAAIAAEFGAGVVARLPQSARRWGAQR